MRVFRSTALLLVALVAVVSTVRAQPDGFSTNQIFKDGFMTDMVFTSDGRMFVSQKQGLIHLYLPGTDYEYDEKTTVLDISEIVCDESERALGGIQLHPNFDTNNWM